MSEQEAEQVWTMKRRCQLSQSGRFKQVCLIHGRKLKSFVQRLKKRLSQQYKPETLVINKLLSNISKLKKNWMGIQQRTWLSSLKLTSQFKPPNRLPSQHLYLFLHHKWTRMYFKMFLNHLWSERHNQKGVRMRLMLCWRLSKPAKKVQTQLNQKKSTTILTP